MTMEFEGTQNAAQSTFSLETALAVLRRRKWPALAVFMAVLSVTAPVPFSVPNTYESIATVLVEHQPMSTSIVGTSPDGDLETRLRTISERILSRSRLLDLAARFNLYPDLRKYAAPEAVAEQMRRDIQIQFNGVRQPTGLDATIAFSLRYRGRDPETVAQVTNALAALYVEENARIREQQATGTAEFLQAQLDGARRQMEVPEQKLSAFRGSHVGQLPEQQAANLAALTRLYGQVHEIKTRQDELTRPVTGGTPDPGGNTISARLARLRRDLADLRMRDTDEHPDVVRIKLEIATLERQMATHSAASTGAGSNPAQPSGSPDPAESELAALRAQEQRLQSQIATYEQKIENAPLIDQELQRLTQDYATARDFYQSLLQRYEGAQLAEQMNRQLQSEQFRILDPAVPPERPAGPHRLRILLVALVLSTGGGAIAALLVEAGDTSFHTVDDVRAFTTIPVLGSIPRITTETDMRRRRRQFRLAALGAALGVVALVGGSSYLTHSGMNPLVHILTRIGT